MDRQPSLVIIDLLADLLGQPAESLAAALGVDLSTNAAITIKTNGGPIYSVHLSIEDANYKTNLGQQPTAVLTACREAASYLVYNARMFYKQLQSQHSSTFAIWSAILTPLPGCVDPLHELKVDLSSSNLYLAPDRAHIGIVVMCNDVADTAAVDTAAVNTAAVDTAATQ